MRDIKDIFKMLPIETLKVLMIRDSEGGEMVTCELPMLHQLFIPHSVSNLKSKCPANCTIITDSDTALEIMTENAKNYPYPSIAECFKEDLYLNDFEDSDDSYMNDDYWGYDDYYNEYENYYDDYDNGY